MVLLPNRKDRKEKMNTTITLLTERRSHRLFQKNHQVSTDDLNAILASARQAPSFENGQFYSIIRLSSPSIRQTLSQLNPNNSQLNDCSEVLLFIADLNRTQLISKDNNIKYDITNNLDALLTATTDASLACENALIASESLGYGTVIVGGIRRQSDEIIKICHLPVLTFPLFILCIGKSLDQPGLKPRLPEEVVLFENQYKSINYSSLIAYDETMKNFRDTGIDKPWTTKIGTYFKKNKLELTNHVLKEQKFII